MKTTAVIAFALAAALTTGCRIHHLGSNTGTAYKQALAEQRESESAAGAPVMSAADAKAVLGAHHGGTEGSAGGGSGAPGMSFSSSAGPAGGGGAWPGATGNITLEAK